MDVATALRPALEAAAATLGRVRVDAERTEDPDTAMDGLRDKGMFVAVPLMGAGGTVEAVFALQVTLPQARTQRGSLDLLRQDRKSTRLNSSHANISYAVFCL